MALYNFIGELAWLFNLVLSILIGELAADIFYILIGELALLKFFGLTELLFFENISMVGD